MYYAARLCCKRHLELGRGQQAVLCIVGTPWHMKHTCRSPDKRSYLDRLSAVTRQSPKCLVLQAHDEIAVSQTAWGAEYDVSGTTLRQNGAQVQSKPVERAYDHVETASARGTL